MVTPFTSMQTLVVTFSIDHKVILLLAYDVANVDLLKTCCDAVCCALELATLE